MPAIKFPACQLSITKLVGDADTLDHKFRVVLEVICKQPIPSQTNSQRRHEHF